MCDERRLKDYNGFIIYKYNDYGYIYYKAITKDGHLFDMNKDLITLKRIIDIYAKRG